MGVNGGWVKEFDESNFYDVHSYTIEYEFLNISPVNKSFYFPKANPKKNYET